MSSRITKIASLLLLSLFLFAAGCGESESPEGGGTAGEQTQEEERAPE